MFRISLINHTPVQQGNEKICLFKEADNLAEWMLNCCPDSAGPAAKINRGTGTSGKTRVAVMEEASRPGKVSTMVKRQATVQSNLRPELAVQRRPELAGKSI